MLSVFGSFGTPARRSPLHFDTAPDHADTTRGDLGATVREAIRKDCFSCSSYIQHTVSTHVQRLYPLIVTGFLQSKHLHTFPFDKFVWAQHSTGVKPFTGPASLENMDCYAKIKSYKKYSNIPIWAATRFPWCHFLDFSAALHCHGSRPLPSPSPRSVPSGW